MSGLAAQHDFLMALLFDETLRDRFAFDRAGVLAEAGLTGADAALFLQVDQRGLELDADSRRDYLMSALCRPYPIAASALGAMPGGARRLSGFLASPAVRGSLSERTRAFGDFLLETLQENPTEAPDEVLQLIHGFLELERARAGTAAALRQSVEEGREPPRAVSHSNNAIKRGKLVLPPFCLAAELPVPSSVMTTALHHASPENAWSLIASRVLSLERVVSVARADEIPVTVLARALSAGRGLERAGAGGVSPIVEVTHRTVELSGRRGGLLAAFDGTRQLADLPPPLAALARNLLDAGLLDLVT